MTAHAPVHVFSWRSMLVDATLFTSVLSANVQGGATWPTDADL